MSWLPKDQWLPAVPPCISVEGKRSAAILEQVVKQFEVETHPRYQPLPARAAVPATATTPAVPARLLTTYCKTFDWDVATAMGIVFPHWVDSVEEGNPVAPFKGVELNINAGLSWLAEHGPRFGWRTVTEIEARACARRGELALAVWKNPTGGHGHTGVIMPPRPGDIVESTWLAQAGIECFEHRPLTAGFGRVIKPLFVAHL